MNVLLDKHVAILMHKWKQMFICGAVRIRSVTLIAHVALLATVMHCVPPVAKQNSNKPPRSVGMDAKRGACSCPRSQTQHNTDQTDNISSYTNSLLDVSEPNV